jgi:ATP-binding cassette subfamily F protein 3
VVSHDRYFLNRLVDQIAALEPGGLYVHDGNYDAYLASWDERADLLERMKAKQDREVKELERFVERFRAKATKAKQAQSRLKRLEKMERIETMQTRQQVRRFQFAEAQRAGKEVAQVEDVHKAYGAVRVYEGLDLTIRRGERVAVVGPNGAGKSTLLKLLAGELTPDRGAVSLGHNVQLAYFGQHQVELLDTKRTVLGELEAYAPFEAIPRCRGILGAFLFTGEDVDKKIAVLSGGERNRVALAKLLLRPTNLLLLDEPTNHLDMDSRDVLLEALDAFEGTLVIVSHDRYFINAIATRVLHIEDGKAESFDGDFEYYHAKSAELARLKEESAAPDLADTPSTERRKDRKRADAERRQRLSRALGDLPKQRDQAEQAIERLEAAIERCTTELADPDLYARGDGARIAELNTSRATAQQELDEVYERWTELSEMIESIEQEHDS